mgnify:CR=1 FL=1
MADQMMFKEFYPYYLSLHKNRSCRRLHFIGQLVTLLFLAFIIYTQFWLLLIVAPLVIYPFAWSGHFFFERNKPAAFKRPLYSKMADWVMFKDILRGKIKA